MLVERIRKVAPPGTVIPKPKSASNKVVGWGKSRGEDALVYAIPTKRGGHRQSTKRIKVSDFQSAHKVLIVTGEFTRSWFKQYLQDCNKDGGCNFTTIGGIFVLLGDASYCKLGVYCKN